MNRTEGHWIRSALALLVLVVPIGASALGLGEARVESFLNQQLDVRMRLLDVSAEELDSLTVAPASPRDFERLGLTSGVLSLDLDVEIDDTVDPPVVRVSSLRPVNDPVIQLVIDARWAGGRVLREYTLFLDPPTVDLAPPPATVTTEPVSEPAPQPQVDPVERAEPDRSAPSASAEATAQPRQTPRAAASGGRYGPVASGETLWSIAQRAMPADDVTMDQMMIAIVELNPSAFRDGNINRLLRGAELEIPDAQRARALDAAAAAAAVAAQNRAFNRGVSASDELPRVSDAGRDALAEPQAGVDSSAPTGQAAGTEPRLSLIPPGENEGGGADGDGDAVDALRQRLARAEEELFAARQEAEDFQNRVEELEQIVRANPSGIGIRDADLAGLQETLRAAREATSEEADPEVRAEVAARLDDYIERLSGTGEPTTADGMETAMAGSQDGPASGVPNDERSDPSTDDGVDEPASAPAPAASPADDGDAGGLPGWAPFAAAALAILVLGLFGLRMIQRRGQARDEAQTARGSSAPASDATLPRDPLDRARARLTESPDDLDRHVELLEQLAAEKREREFSDALEAMFEHVDSGAEPQWRRALKLAGRIVPGHTLVKGSADWVADDLTDRASSDSALDEEAEVDDLMARLEADEADEPASDESEWPDFDEGGEKTEGGPTTGASEADDDESFDFQSVRSGEGQLAGSPSESADEEQSGGLEFDLPEADSDTKPATADGGDEGSEYESPTLEWPQFGEYAGDEALADGGKGGSGSEAEPADAEESEDGDAGASETDEIFGQSDDDIDVKLDLARAYLSWDSADSARTLLEEVLREGNPAQQEQARKLLDEQGGESES
mgnify:FL=1